MVVNYALVQAGDGSMARISSIVSTLVRGIWMQRGSTHCNSEKRDDSQSSESGGRKDQGPDPIVIFQSCAFRAFGVFDDVAFDPSAHDPL
jgi:hypothetical protein